MGVEIPSHCLAKAVPSKSTTVPNLTCGLHNNIVIYMITIGATQTLHIVVCYIVDVR